MTLTWTAFESSLSGHSTPFAAIDALTTASMEEVQVMLDGIGAGEAGGLLAAVRAAESETRLSKLAAALEIIDRRLPAGRVRKATLFSRGSVRAGQLPDADSVRCALLASLIDAALGGDPEGLRARIAVAATGWERALAAELNGLSKSGRETETTAARRVLQAVIKLLLNELESRPTA